jgi:hypothetical protein
MASYGFSRQRVKKSKNARRWQEKSLPFFYFFWRGVVEGAKIAETGPIPSL